MHFRDSPDSLNGLRIPGNIWFRRFAVTYATNVCKISLQQDIMRNGQHQASVGKEGETGKSTPPLLFTWNGRVYNLVLSQYSFYNKFTILFEWNELKAHSLPRAT